ncbi:hypothetical protein [Cellvibrio sp.]
MIALGGEELAADELAIDEPGVDAIDEDIGDELTSERHTELPAEDAGLLLACTNPDDPPPPPPQAMSNVQMHTSSVRPLQDNIGRAIVVLMSRPIWPTPLLIKTDYVKHSQDRRRAQK